MVFSRLIQQISGDPGNLVQTEGFLDVFITAIFQQFFDCTGEAVAAR
jgi:hypothetical protein